MVRPDAKTDAGALVVALRQRDPLFKLIYEFNMRPSRYIHASWAEALFTPELWRRLRQTRSAERSLSRMVLHDLDLAGSFPAAIFAQPAARLALLDSDTVERTALYIGIVVNSARLRRSIGRKEVARLRQALGEDAYLFAVQRAPLLAPRQEPAEADDAFQASADLPERLRRSGATVLARALAGLPAEVLKRFRLKLPRQPTLDFAISDGRAAATALAIRVLKETEPRWAPLFAAPAA